MLRYVALGLAVALVGCQGRNVSGPNRTFTMLVLGVAHTDLGSPVSGATVRMTALEPSTAPSSVKVGNCQGIEVSAKTLTTDPSGSFSAEYFGGGAPSYLCLTIEVIPPNGVGLQTRVISQDSLLLGPPNIGGRDSVRIEIILART